MLPKGIARGYVVGLAAVPVLALFLFIKFRP
jgi:tetrahydromethanopterin S-methyltransferase subunit B